MVSVNDTEPRIWRRLTVAGDLKLDALHDVLQTAIGWTDSHLHRFYAGPSTQAAHFVTPIDVAEGIEGTLESTVRLDQLLRTPGDVLTYEYDFGDGWEHELRLEGVQVVDPKGRPRCTDGAGAGPPEDVGGPRGYAELAAWVRGGRRPDAVPASFHSAANADAWLPEGWHPDRFSAEDADRALETLVVARGDSADLRPGAREAVRRLSPRATRRVTEWLSSASRTTLSRADLDDLTAPYRTLLAVIGGGVELTSSGYLRPPVVAELCPALGVDPILAGKANRESNVRPLLMFRKNVQQVGLLHVSGGLLMPTVKGIELGDDADRLWSHVSSRLPVGRGELKKEVGWFSLAGPGRRDPASRAVRRRARAGGRRGLGRQ